jgi:hypothetical protein
VSEPLDLRLPGDVRLVLAAGPPADPFPVVLFAEERGTVCVAAQLGTDGLLQLLRALADHARAALGPVAANMAASLGRHGMAPDRRHTLCGFDIAGERKLPDPPEDLDHHRVIECPLCLAMLAAVG